MKLSDIQSKELLPEFAHDLDWVQNSFDALIRPTVERVKSIDAPLTMEAIEALTDEELQALYEQYGVAIYYPDLARDTRNRMLYEMCKIYRYLGTPHAVETLCKYIFDSEAVKVTIHDNLAWDSNGNLIHPELLDIFDIEVEPFLYDLPPDGADRIIANILNFSRNSQCLRSVWYILDENRVDVSSAVGIPYDYIGVVINVENNEIVGG